MKRAGTFAGAIAAAFQAAAVHARTERAGQDVSLSGFLVSDDFAAPYFRESDTWPSPVVLAIAQAARGEAVTDLDDETCRAVFGCGADELPDELLRTVAVGAGRGGGKTSSLLVPAAVHAMWTCALPNVKRGETPAAVVVSPELEQARAAFNFALGLIEASPVLREYLDRKATTKERIVLSRPDGKRVEFLTLAAKAGGGSIRSKTLVFLGLDECSFFRGEEYAGNDREIYDAGKGSIVSRRIAGAQIWLVSSPWIEGEGLLEECIDSDWGRHRNAVVAARVSTYLLRGEEDDGSLRAEYGADEEEAYRREILAIPLPRGSRQFFSGEALLEAEKRLPPSCTPAERAGGIDIAHSRDASAVAAAARFQVEQGALFAAIALREVKSAPSQKPSDTYRALAAVLTEHGITRYIADKYCKAPLREVTDPMRIAFHDAPDYVAPWRAARDLFAEGRVALGKLPEPQRRSLLQQLAAVVGVERPGLPGSLKIVLPRLGTSPGNKRGCSHCDSAAAFVLSLWAVGSGDRGRWRRVLDRPSVHRQPPDRRRRTERSALRAYCRGGLGR